MFRIIFTTALLSSSCFLLHITEAKSNQAIRGVKTIFDTKQKSSNSLKRRLQGDFLGSILDLIDSTKDEENESDEEEIVDLFEGDKNETLLGVFNLTDSFDNITDGFQDAIDTFQNWTDEIFGDLNLTADDGSFNVSDSVLDSDFFENLNLTDGGFFGDINLTDGGLFNDLNLTDVLFNVSEGIFGDLNLTDGFLSEFFNNTDGIFGNFNFTGGMFGSFFNQSKAATILTPGLVEGWLDDVVFEEDTTCTNDDSAPECFDQYGQEGFWACRTLSNPFSGQPSSTSVCISKGQFLADNDQCGCCTPEGSDEPSCPAVCECSCDRKGESDGVLLTMKVLSVNRTICVDPRYAVTAVASSKTNFCDESCKLN